MLNFLQNMPTSNPYLKGIFVVVVVIGHENVVEFPLNFPF